MYSLVVQSTGFAKEKTRDLAVTTGQVSVVPVTLSIQGGQTQVNVSEQPEDLQLENSTLGGLVGRDMVQALPLATRNYTQILALFPGIVVDLPRASSLDNGTQNVSSEGASPLSNNVQFNGVDANNLVQNSAAQAESSQTGTAIPAPDTIQEVRVQTANYDAAYGRGSGANIDLVTRAGTNQFHGSVWEFVRNNIFNANEFFAKQEGQPRAELKQNQFGASVGGPLRKNNLFFFGSYQGTRVANGLAGATHPILPLLTADRSAAALGAQFCPADHLNAQGAPANGYLTQAGGTQLACDGSNINPVALAILNAKLPTGQFAVPSPQIALPVSSPDQLPLGQSTFAPPAYRNEDQFTVNLDKTLTTQNTLAGRFFWSRANTTEPFSPNAANVPGWGTTALNRNTNFVLADTHVVNARMVNLARFGYIRFDGLAAVQNPIVAQAIGQGIPTGAPAPDSHAPGLTVGGFTIGDGGTPDSWSVTNSFIWQDVVAFTAGRHNLRSGAEVKRVEVDEDQPEETDGLLQIGTFSDFLVGQSAAQNGSPLGLSNITLSFAGAGNFRRDTRYTDFAGFAQDDFNVSPRFTLNLGLRYEIFSAPVETHGRVASFDPAIATTGPIPAAGTLNGFTVPANFEGTIPEGVTKHDFAGQYRTPMGDLSPRFGFSYQLTKHPTLLLRGGYGLYYDRHSNTIAEQTLSQSPFATLQVGFGSQNASATLASPFTPLVQPASHYPFFVTRSAANSPFVEAIDPDLQDGRTQQYNLNLQYALPHAYVLQVGYVGTSSTHRSGQVEFDQATLASPSAPVNGETANSISNVNARLPIQGLSQGSLETTTTFVANYNALQVGVSRQYSHGFGLQASYTWSKNLDEVNGEVGTDVFELQLPSNNQNDLRHSSYGLAGDDRDQRAVVSFVYRTPELSTLPRVARSLVSHWDLSGIGVIQSGIPLSIVDGNAGSVYGLLGGESRAQLSGSMPSTKGSIFSRVGSGYLNPAAFTRAPEIANGTSLADQDFGNSPVGLVRGPGQHNLDVAVEHEFPVHVASREAGSFRFRAEFFNVTNTPQFGNPDTSLGYTDPTAANPVPSQTFGRISGTQGNPRIIQFAARYQF